MKDNEVRHISLTKVNGTFKIMGVSSFKIWQNINKNCNYCKISY